MSSSTVSITGASLRPRPMEKKSDQIVANSPITNTPSKSKSKTENDTVLETTTKPLPTTSTTVTKKTKKTVTKKSDVIKPKWKTVVSVLVKNLGLLVILLLLIQMVRKLGFGGGGLGGSLVGFESDYETRIAEVESFVKKTTKMMQVQVEVVDRKVESEISGLRLELSKRIDHDNKEFSKKFDALESRIGVTEKSLKNNEWLTRNEFDMFVEEVKRKNGGEMKLDEIREFARSVVEKEIGKHAADGLGRVDYAVASGGASVLKHSEAYGGVSNRVVSWLKGDVRSDAVKVLQPSFGQPGECFPLKGESGFVEIKLRSAIVPEAVTLEHVSKSVAFDRSSAPKDCRVLGWLRNEEETEKEHLLTEFTYDLEKSNAQTFNVLGTEGSNPTVINTIRLEFLSNHGSPTHTCIYRVRVHGHQLNGS